MNSEVYFHQNQERLINFETSIPAKHLPLEFV